jgi:hypothetical protein
VLDLGRLQLVSRDAERRIHAPLGETAAVALVEKVRLSHSLVFVFVALSLQGC